VSTIVQKQYWSAESKQSPAQQCMVRVEVKLNLAHLNLLFTYILYYELVFVCYQSVWQWLTLHHAKGAACKKNQMLAKRQNLAVAVLASI